MVNFMSTMLCRLIFIHIYIYNCIWLYYFWKLCWLIIRIFKYISCFWLQAASYFEHNILVNTFKTLFKNNGYSPDNAIQRHVLYRISRRMCIMRFYLDDRINLVKFYISHNTMITPGKFVLIEMYFSRLHMVPGVCGKYVVNAGIIELFFCFISLVFAMAISMYRSKWLTGSRVALANSPILWGSIDKMYLKIKMKQSNEALSLR